MNMQGLKDILLTEFGGFKVTTLKSGALKYTFKEVETLNKAIKFINIAFNSVVFSVDDLDLIIVNC